MTLEPIVIAKILPLALIALVGCSRPEPIEKVPEHYAGCYSHVVNDNKIDFRIYTEGYVVTKNFVERITYNTDDEGNFLETDSAIEFDQKNFTLERRTGDIRYIMPLQGATILVKVKSCAIAFRRFFRVECLNAFR